MYPIIDSHVHVYPDKIAEKAAMGTGSFYGLNMTYNGTVSQLKEESKKVGIAHAVIFSVATTPKQVRSINDFIAQTVSEDKGFFTGLGAIHPLTEDIEGELKYVKQLGLKGVKIHPEIQNFILDDERSLEICRLCEKYDLILFAHTGDKRFDMSNPNRLKTILEKFPNLTVVAAHLSGWSVWEQVKNTLPKYKNLYVDCSSSFPFLSYDKAVELVREYGSERVMWGSDYPMWDYTKEVSRFNGLPFTESERENILYKSAQKLFGISLKSL